MKKIASIIALSIASSVVSTAASASMVNVTGTLGSWKSWNAASKAPIPVFVTKNGIDLVQATTPGVSIAGPAGTISIALTGSVDSVTGYGTLSQVGSFTGYYDVDADFISDDSYANSGAGGSLTFTGLSWTLDATGMHQTGGSAYGCDAAAPQCQFTKDGVNVNDHQNGFYQSVFDFQGINAGFQTLPKTNLSGTAYGTYAKTWAAVGGLNSIVVGPTTITANLASRINSGSVSTNSANTATLNLTAGALPPPPNSTTKNWVGSNFGSWSTASNWDTATTPVAGDTVNVVKSGSQILHAIYDSSATSVQLAELNIGATGSGGQFTFIQESGDLKATKEYIGLAGNSALSKFIQNGGTHTVGTLNMGIEYGNAQYQLTAGTLTATNENIGYGGSASFIQDGGTHNVTNTLSIGTSQNDSNYTEYGIGHGGYTLNGGTLNAASEYIGDNGSSGSFTQNGGTHTVGSLTMGEGYADYYSSSYQYGYGSYTLNGGTFNVGNIYNGYYGHSELIINGGSLNLTGSAIRVDLFELGKAAGSNASFTLAAGKTLEVTDSVIGRNGVGSFTQNGGTHRAKTLDIKNGSYALNAGSLNVNTIQNSGEFTIAAGASAIGQTLGGDYDYYGNEIPLVESSFTQTAGVTQVDGLLQVDSVVIQGGVLQGNGNIQAPVDVTGGTLSAGEIIGALSINGTLTLNGGTLLTDITGTENGEHDVLTVNGDVNLTGGTLAFSFGGGFTAQAGDELEFLKGNVLGSLENMLINFNGIPQGLSGIVSKTATGLKLSFVQAQAVPVPAAAWLMGTGLVSLGAIKRRKKAA